MADFLEYVPFRLLQLLTSVLPFRAAGGLGSFLGSFVYAVTGYRRKVTFDNLRHAFPAMSARELRRIAHGAYRNYARTLTEMLWAGTAEDEKLMEIVDTRTSAPFNNLIRSGKGFILLSGHMGGWEHLAHGVRLNMGKPFNMIVQRQRNRYSDAMIDRFRRRHGNRTIPMGPGAREALTVLKSDGVLGALADQSGPEESIYVDFFGRPAATHRGIAAFSLRTASPILFAVLVRGPDGRYTLVAEEVPQQDLDGYSESNIEELTRRHVALLEKYIRQYPEQWLWMHKRWKHTESYLSDTSPRSGR